MKVLLVGEGDSLYFLSRDIISKGHHVTVVDNDLAECTRLSRELNATVVNGDGSYSTTLEDAGAIGMDVLRHRVIVSYEAEAEEKSSEDIIRRIFEEVEVP